MRVVNRLRVISAVGTLVLVGLAPLVVWSFLAFADARKGHDLSAEIMFNVFERASLRDQYFLHPEDRVVALWDERKEAADRLFRLADRQIRGAEDRRRVERMREGIDRIAAIFHRIVGNAAAARTMNGDRTVRDELDKRLRSQLLLRAAAVRDAARELESANLRRVEQTYRRLLVVIGTSAVLLALATIVVGIQLGRQVRRGLAPLHGGAKRISGGDLGHRFEVDGSDEFSDLARAFNATTDKLRDVMARHREEVGVREDAEEEIRRLNVALEARVLELEGAVREMESFSYSVAHDLRAPVRAVDSFAAILARDFGDEMKEEERRLIGKVRENSRRMGLLIDDLLEFSRTSRTAMTAGPIDMNRLASEVVEAQAAAAAKAGVELRVGALPPAIGDERLIRIALENLVSNAVKFSSGRPAAVAELGARPGDGGPEYFVRDNGAGFDPEFGGKLFGVFQRLHRTEEFEGTGIGLALVKRIVERHGGKVRAEGQPGRGATFSFTLPDAAAVPEPVPSDPPRAPGETTRPAVRPVSRT